MSFVDIDIRLSNYMQGKPAVLRPVMLFVTGLGMPAVLGCMTMVLSFVAYSQGQSLYVIGFALCLAALAMSGVLKIVLRRRRPLTVYVRSMRFKTFSFPSGHALGTLVLHGYIISLGFVTFSTTIAWLSALVLGSLILLTGYSRVYLGAHFVSDVLGGWLLGSVALIIIVESTL